MALETKTLGDAVVAKIADSRILDELLIQELGDALLVLTQSDAIKLVVNFDEVEFMSSAMIGKLVLLNKKSKSAGKELIFCNINDNLMEVFKLTNLDRVFKFADTEAAAIG